MPLCVSTLVWCLAGLLVLRPHCIIRFLFIVHFESERKKIITSRHHKWPLKPKMVYFFHWNTIFRFELIFLYLLNTLHTCFQIFQCKGKKSIPVTGRGRPWGCETSRFPHFLDNRLTRGGKVVSLTRLLPFTPRNIPGTHFC
jgi:hypothetical protein